MIQQTIIILGVDYTIPGNQRMLKQQQQSCSTTISLLKPGDLFRLSLVTHFNTLI